MYAARNTPALPAPYTWIKLYADLSKAALLNRKKLTTINKSQPNNNIGYKWGFPTKLTIKRQGKSHTIRGRPSPAQRMGNHSC